MAEGCDGDPDVLAVGVLGFDFAAIGVLLLFADGQRLVGQCLKGGSEYFI